MYFYGILSLPGGYFFSLSVLQTVSPREGQNMHGFKAAGWTCLVHTNLECLLHLRNLWVEYCLSFYSSCNSLLERREVAVWLTPSILWLFSWGQNQAASSRETLLTAGDANKRSTEEWWEWWVCQVSHITITGLMIFSFCRTLLCLTSDVREGGWHLCLTNHLWHVAGTGKFTQKDVPAVL